MKYIFPFILVLVAMSGGCAPDNQPSIASDKEKSIEEKNNEAPSDTEIEEDTMVDVYTTFHSGSAQLTVTYVNNSEKALNHGAEHRLQRFHNSEWIEVPFDPDSDLGWLLMGYILETGESYEQTIDLKGHHGELTPGRYRVVKEMDMNVQYDEYGFMKNKETIEIFAEFEIK